MDTLIRLTNEWRGTLAYCERHIDRRRPHLLGDQIAETREMGECPDCHSERQHAAAPAEMRAALLAPDFSHTRCKSWCGVSQVYAYRYDRTSPSGVFLATSLDEARFNQVVAELRAEGITLHGGHSPLSPTEAR